MKIKGKLRKFICALLLLTVALSAAACTDGKERVREDTLIILPAQFSAYSPQAKTEAAEGLYADFSVVVKEVHGNTTTVDNLLNDYKDKAMPGIQQFIAACENRKIPQRDMQSALAQIGEDKAFLRALVLAVKEDTPLPVEAAGTLFGDLSLRFGAENTSFLFYDFAHAYCAFMERRSQALFEAHPEYTFLQGELEKWQSYQAELTDIGENNFSRLLRFGVSAFAVLPTSDGGKGATDYVATLSAGEVALLLNAQGDMLLRLDCTPKNWQFVYTALGDNVNVLAFRAIEAAKDEERLSIRTGAVIGALARSLKGADAEVAKPLLEGDFSAFLCRLVADWSEEDWRAFESLFTGENEQAYKEFFRLNRMLNKYTKFKEEINAATLEELRTAGEEDFLVTLQNYLSGIASGLAFAVFGI